MAITELKPYLSNIADKLKSLLGITDKINAQDFVEKIDEVYEQGKKSQYDEFWDNYQNEGNRTNYDYSFARDGWTEDTFKPKYDIKPTTGLAMFYFCKIVDLRGVLKNQGVTLDLSKVINFANFFQGSRIEYIGAVDITGATTAVSSLFQQCYFLKEVSELIVKETNTFSNTTFGNCESLYAIKISGIIGSSISFLSSPNLTHESLMSIINALKKLDTGITATLTLHEIAKSSLTDSEKATITQKGWTLA